MDCQVLFLFTVLLCVSIASSLKLPSSICLPTLKRCGDNSACADNQRCRRGRCCKEITFNNPFCSSGVFGPRCSKSNPCKPGYTCRMRKCCRDPVCPKGMAEGGSCNLLPGQQRCKNGYECIKNFCCKSKVKPVLCPSGVVGKTCSKPNWCKSGICLPIMIGRCAPGYECINDICCPSKPDPPCPVKEQGPVCSKKSRCKPGYTCKSEVCCRDIKPTLGCPIGMIGSGLCRAPENKEQLPCSPGYKCINDHCCKSLSDIPIKKCPFGRKYMGTCSKGNICATGATCHNGVCCSTDDIGMCPFRQTATGDKCDKVKTCPRGSTCHSGSCCRSTFVFRECPTFGPLQFCPPKSPMDRIRCTQNSDCKISGQMCCPDRCRRNYCYTPPASR